jgi:hypothetical protein
MAQTVVQLQQHLERSLAAVARRRFDLCRVAVGRFVSALLDWA